MQSYYFAYQPKLAIKVVANGLQQAVTTFLQFCDNPTPIGIGYGLEDAVSLALTHKQARKYRVTHTVRAGR